ncbi:hypothetical protein [Adlercreutzia sp. ZJ242]|uniref:hypothetical protein n=1 Tax=Adlercreutzia sp. ZJ242 TaxID=2709409 RepID=UPI0013EC736B|nr:hypothetical protein [Adlercreutzia sp. ZJ242]
MTASRQMIESAIDLTAVMAAEQIAAYEQTSTAQALLGLLSSNVGAQLFDDSLKLWWDGPSAIAEAYQVEQRKACIER